MDRSRLSKLLGMMGSAHDGEVLNAGRAADRLVRQAGATWDDVLGPEVKSSAAPKRPFYTPPAPPPPEPEWWDHIGIWLRRPRMAAFLDGLFEFCLGMAVLIDGLFFLISLFVWPHVALVFGLLVVVALMIRHRNFILFMLFIVPGGTLFIVGSVVLYAYTLGPGPHYGHY